MDDEELFLEDIIPPDNIIINNDNSEDYKFEESDLDNIFEDDIPPDINDDNDIDFPPDNFENIPTYEENEDEIIDDIVQDTQDNSNNDSSDNINYSESFNSLSKRLNPIGFASINISNYIKKTSVYVSSKKELIEYAKKGGYTIYVDNNIDFSNNKIPMNTDGTTKYLDEWISTKSNYSSYSLLKKSYISYINNTEENNKECLSAIERLIKLYESNIIINIASNTDIIGINNVILTGVSFNITDAYNVCIKNLTIKNTFDPFPSFKNGAFKAKYDSIYIDNSKNIWIDNCIFLIDIVEDDVLLFNNKLRVDSFGYFINVKNESDNITISNCNLSNNDTLINIGSNIELSTQRNVTIVNCNCNYSLCGIFVSNTNIHCVNLTFNSINNKCDILFYNNVKALIVDSDNIVIDKNTSHINTIKISFNKSEELFTIPYNLKRT